MPKLEDALLGRPMQLQVGKSIFFLCPSKGFFSIFQKKNSCLLLFLLLRGVQWLLAVCSGFLVV